MIPYALSPTHSSIVSYSSLRSSLSRRSFVERSDLVGTSRTVVVTGLTSQRTYKFKVSITTSLGTALSGESLGLLLVGMDLVISGYIEEGTEKAIQLFNPTSVTLNTRDYALVLAQYTGDSSGSSATLVGRIIIKGEGEVRSDEERSEKLRRHSYGTSTSVSGTSVCNIAA